MTPEKLFQRNLALWAAANPQAAIYLHYVDSDHLQITKTDLEELNLERTDLDLPFFFHSNQGALQEAEEWLSKLNLKQVDVLYVYGVGLGYAYQVLKPWLRKSKKHRLVFLEDDLAVIKNLFETEHAHALLRDKKVTLIYFDSLEATHSALSELYWKFMTLKIAITALPTYKKAKHERYEELLQKIPYDATMRYSLVDEFLNYGIVFFRNFYQNMLWMEGTYLGSSLFNKFDNIPAIICGAGPSLGKNLHLLKDVSNHAMIFAGGSALNALQAEKITPHFGAGIDPNPAQAERVMATCHLDIPFLFRNRLYHDAFRMVQGKKLYIPGSGGYDIAGWFEEKFEIPGNEIDIDEGFNVVNFCLAIAQAMGCNPIIFIGMDLAYTQLESYAKGVVEDVTVKEKEITEAKNLDSTAILRADIFGNQVYTLWKWIAESVWIGEFAQKNPEIDLINATEGGIGFPGIANEKLDDVIKKHLKKMDGDLKQRIAQEIEECALKQMTTEKLIEAQKKMRESLVRCYAHLMVLIQSDDSFIKLIKETQIAPRILQSGEAVVSELELAEELGYIYVLDIFNQIYGKVLQNELHDSKQHRADWKRALARLEVNGKRLRFLKDVTEANIALIENALEKAPPIMS